MHIIQEIIWAPRITFVNWASWDNTATISISPLPSWYWMTLGNAFRRVLLSSLPWTAIAWIKIPWITHEYMTIDWVKDSVLDIVLNLKWVHLKKFDKDRSILKLVKKWTGVVTAWDIQVDSWVEILNPDHVITSFTWDNKTFEMDIIVEKGVWYLGVEDRNDKDELSDFIFTDVAFSPITKIKYDIKPARVWDMTALDNLEIQIETNGSISAHDALKFAAQVLTSYFELFTKESEQVEKDFIVDYSRCWMIEEEWEKESYTPIEILNLSPRTLNALINADIWSIEQLAKCSQAKLSTLRWFWRKAMTEVLTALEKRSLTLLWD